MPDVTRDLNSVAQDSDSVDTDARDQKGSPAFLREATPGQVSPDGDVAGYSDEMGTHLPRFMRNANPDGLSAVLEADGTPAGHTPAVKQHVGLDNMRSLSDKEQAKRARNRADLRKSRDVIKTTDHRKGKKQS